MKYIALMLLALACAGCQNPSGNPALATMPYPMELHKSESVPIQVHRNEEFLEIVNSTAVDYERAILWINQRFSKELQPLLAGSTLRVDLWSLRDVFGEQFNAGGIWRTDEPTPVVIAELQTNESQSLVGLVVIGQD